MYLCRVIQKVLISLLLSIAFSGVLGHDFQFGRHPIQQGVYFHHIPHSGSSHGHDCDEQQSSTCPDSDMDIYFGLSSDINMDINFCEIPDYIHQGILLVPERPLTQWNHNELIIIPYQKLPGYVRNHGLRAPPVS